MNGTQENYLANLGLDPYFNAVDRLGNNTLRKTSFDFDSELERDSVTSAHLRNASIKNAQLGTAIIGTAQVGTLSFNEISGGTATLGGTNNGNGLVSVKDSAGSQIVVINSSGINMRSGTTEVGKITFIRSDDANKYVEMRLIEGGASPYDFAIDKSGSLNLGDFYIGNSRNWSNFTVNVDLSAELLGGGTLGGTSVRLSVGNGTMLVKFGGTTMMSLNPAGDLKVRGTLGTGITGF